MKYRMLEMEELRPLEEELKHFLIVNGVHDTEWEQLNREQPETARKLVELFSDNVLQKVYERIRFLEYRSTDTCMVFHLEPDRIDMISISVKAGGKGDFSTLESIHETLVNHAHELTWFRSAKTYSSERETEVHQMLEQGCILSSQEFWASLEKSLS